MACSSGRWSERMRRLLRFLAMFAMTLPSWCPAQGTDYAVELARARAAGLLTRPSDLKRPTVPEAQNAAPLYRELDARVKAGRPASQNDNAITAILGRTRPTEAQIARARDLLRERADLLLLIHKAAARRSC